MARIQQLLFCLASGFFVLAMLGSHTATGQTFPTTGPVKNIVNLVCIGDSITASGQIRDREKNGSPAILAGELAGGLGNGTTVYLANAGVSGTTTADWSGPAGLLVRGPHSAEASAKKLMADHPEAKLLFSIMLGTNDSANKGTRGAPISADRYEKEMKRITNELVQTHPGCLIFLHRPIWYSMNTHNSADYEGDSAHDRLKSYFPVIDAIVDADAKSPKQHVFHGDTLAYDYFAKNYQSELNPEKGKNGIFYLHPNLPGAKSLGKFWSLPIISTIKK